MTTRILSHLLAENGKYIVMPPEKAGQLGWGNVAHPNVHEAGGDVAMRYPVNTRFVDFDREFIYGYTESVYTSGKANLGLFNTNVEETITFGTVAGVIADTTLGLLTPVTDETTAAANIFAGGFFMPRTNPYANYRIVSNTAYNGGTVGTTEMDIVIEEPGLGAAVTASQASCKLDRNPYTAMRQEWAGGNAVMSVVGVTMILPVASRYQWVQVAGPCMLFGDEAAGKSDYLRAVWWHIDGSVVAGAQGDPSATNQRQYAGYIMGTTSSSYCWLIMMTKLG